MESTVKSEFQWFVLHTLSGQEQKVKDSIEKRIKVEEMAEWIKEVLIPTEKVAEVKKGKKTTSTRKFYPGYILVHMKLLDEKNQLQEKVAPKVAFEKGETVKVTDGPFQNFTGVIDEIDPDRGKLKISVSIFGRSTPVELEYWQVE